MKIVWTSVAEDSLIKIADDILERFSVKEEEKFLEEVDRVIKSAATFPKSFPKSRIKKFAGSRKAVIHPHSTLFYRERRKSIELLLFWDNRNDPAKLK